MRERIRGIRDCQPKFYQKITDLYAWSSDHVKESRQTKDFPASDQNKLQFHYKLTEIRVSSPNLPEAIFNIELNEVKYQVSFL
ncbi:hypothetical protein P872_14075 [Rhodonellum psychrophilum GCM71 = DSM 17998]|uniref:Uncharacterized protein n=1 Tax=Rhodonellum psychrophilum GCM71 = DSM 17998 TaxID=1123057 RepID=U5BWB3_9BACT|nr:hypothetical protein P872_14075 [Rhodonellum psychrophilum GCM71 = DSM 17998]